MKLRNAQKFSPTSKVLHWFIALLVIIMLCGGFFLDGLPESIKGMAISYHKSTGLTILFLMILRIIWIHAAGRPPLPESMKMWEKMTARIVQYGFYILLILMPLSGWIMSVSDNRIPTYFGLFQLPLPWIHPDKSLADLMFESHRTIAWVLIVFIGLHIAGALKHHFIDKDNVLKRMLPGRDK